MTAGGKYAIAVVKNINHFLKVFLINERNISLVLGVTYEKSHQLCQYLGEIEGRSLKLVTKAINTNPEHDNHYSCNRVKIEGNLSVVMKKQGKGLQPIYHKPYKMYV
jgi:hypothetical protein